MREGGWEVHFNITTFPFVYKKNQSATHDKLSIYSIYIFGKTLAHCQGKKDNILWGHLTVVNAAWVINYDSKIGNYKIVFYRSNNISHLIIRTIEFRIIILIKNG